MSLEDNLKNIPEGVESEDVKELRNVLYRLQKQLIKAKMRNEDLVEATHRAAYDAMLTMGPIKPVEQKVTKGASGKAEVALWHMTDWQGAKKTTTYNECNLLNFFSHIQIMQIEISKAIRSRQYKYNFVFIKTIAAKNIRAILV